MEITPATNYFFSLNLNKEKPSSWWVGGGNNDEIQLDLRYSTIILDDLKLDDVLQSIIFNIYLEGTRIDTVTIIIIISLTLLFHLLIRSTYILL